MKKILLSTLALLTIGSNTLLTANDSGLYLGLGYAATNIDLTIDGLPDDANNILDQTTDSVIFLAGYDFNEYFGVESRYYYNASAIAFQYELGSLPIEYKAESLTFYAKPQYNLGVLTAYGLVGVALNDYTVSTLLGGNNDEALFSWGAGAKFSVTNSLGLFVDYTDMGESTNITNTNLNSWNFGATYRF